MKSGTIVIRKRDSGRVFANAIDVSLPQRYPATRVLVIDDALRMDLAP